MFVLLESLCCIHVSLCSYKLCAAELDEILAETGKVSPQVDAYLADNGAANSKGHGKQSRQTDDIEAQ